MTNKFKMKLIIKALRGDDDTAADKAADDLMVIAEQLDAEVMQMGVAFGDPQ